MFEPVTLGDIEARAKRYSDAREKLTALVADLNAGMDALKRQSMAEIKRAIARASEHEAELRALIEAAPDLFVKPKTVIFHGIKLGYQKGKGKIEWDNAEQVVKLIKKHFPAQTDLLIVTRETPAKDALNNLSAGDLKKLGISITEGGEAVFIRPTDSAVDKMVDALLKAATEEVAA